MIFKSFLLPALFALTASATPATAKWVASPLPRADVSMRSVQAVGSTEFHISGSKGFYAVSKDGGRTWRKVAVPGAEDLDFRGLAVVAPGRVVLMSAGDGSEGRAKLFRTEDAGATWTLAHEDPTKGAFFDSIAFWNARDGLVVGDPVGGSYMILRTADGGKTWARVVADMAGLLPAEAAFAASNSALALAPGGRAWIGTGGAPRARVFRSADYGKSWEMVDAPIEAGPTGGVFGVKFLTPKDGLIVGGDHKAETRPSANIAMSTDGGASWLLSKQDGAPTLKEGIGQLDATTLLAVGPKGTSISTDRGATWRVIDQEAFHAISCGKGACVAVGGQGRVATWQAD